MAETQTPLSLPIINRLASNFVGIHHISLEIFSCFLTFIICAFRLRTIAAKILNDGAQTNTRRHKLPQKLQDRKSATEAQLQQVVDIYSATELSFSEIAKIVGVHRCAVSK